MAGCPETCGNRFGWRGTHLSRCDCSLVLAAEDALGLWLGLADGTQHREGAAPAQGMHRSAQVPTYRAPHIVLPGTYMTPAPSQQKLLQLHGTCPGKVVSQLHAQRCRSRKKDNPKGFQIGVRALLLVSVELRTSISKHPSHTITSQDMQLPTALAARHR